MRFLSLLAGLILSLAMPALTSAWAVEKRVALVVGVSAYTNVGPLTNPTKDARLIAPLLRQLGFETTLLLDPDRAALAAAVSDFSERVEGAAVALFYFAGHGMQIDGHNYLLPTDARVERRADLDFAVMDLQTVLKHMEAPNRVNLVFLDACRDNPTLSRSLSAWAGARSAAGSRGLAREDRASQGMLIAYATAPGEVAADGEGGNSPFTAALAKNLALPGVEVRQIMTRVRVEVMRATNQRQQPWDHSSLNQEFYFVPPAVSVPPLGQEGDALFWTSVQASTDPRDFAAYLEQHPRGQFAALARNRLERLGRQAMLAAPSSPALPAPPASSSSAASPSVPAAVSSSPVPARPPAGPAPPATIARPVPDVSRGPEPEQQALLSPRPMTPPVSPPNPAAGPKSVGPGRTGAEAAALERAREQARALPCAVLTLVSGPDGNRVLGFARAGGEFDRWLAGARNGVRLISEVKRVDPFGCAPLAAVSAFAARFWDGTPAVFAIRPERLDIAGGARLVMEIVPSRPFLYVDLYREDGSVRHLSRPASEDALPGNAAPGNAAPGNAAPGSASTVTRVEMMPGPEAGPGLVVAIGGVEPLALGVRPETETASDYLAVLRARLQEARTPPLVALALVMARPGAAVKPRPPEPAVAIAKPHPAEPAAARPRPAEPPVARISQPRPPMPALRTGRCANIISRVQMGETLSDGERAALRTECRS